MSPGYIGRFAPSPTGPLHRGSLVAALGSYLQAKKHNGTWLLRMEDIDPPREIPGAADLILRSLEAHGLYWDNEIVYQSQRSQSYDAAIDALLQKQIAYPCSCSRKQLSQNAQAGAFGLIYPGTCRTNTGTTGNRFSLRVKTDSEIIEFMDLRMGKQQQHLASELGDFIIKRADGFYAYQLAVVVDDAWQQITEIVRGEDLLDNTARQIYLQRILGYPTPGYCHLPLVRNRQGQKLSKQTYAAALDDKQPSRNLVIALQALGIEMGEAFHSVEPQIVLDEAVNRWSIPSR